MKLLRKTKWIMRFCLRSISLLRAFFYSVSFSRTSSGKSNTIFPHFPAHSNWSLFRSPIFEFCVRIPGPLMRECDYYTRLPMSIVSFCGRTPSLLLSAATKDFCLMKVTSVRLILRRFYHTEKVPRMTKNRSKDQQPAVLLWMSTTSRALQSWKNLLLPGSWSTWWNFWNRWLQSLLSFVGWLVNSSVWWWSFASILPGHGGKPLECELVKSLVAMPALWLLPSPDWCRKWSIEKARWPVLRHDSDWTTWFVF